MDSSGARLGTRETFANARLRRLLLAYAGAAVSEWTVWLAVLVFVQEQSGSAAAGWMALALLVPLVVAAPFAARAFAGPRPERVLGLVFLGQFVALTSAAVLAVTGAPLALLAIPASVAIGGVSFVRPGQAVLAPGIVRTARELTTANLFVGYIDSGCVLAGPIIATACLAVGGVGAALGMCALFAAGGIVAARSMWADQMRANERVDAEALEPEISASQTTWTSQTGRRNQTAPDQIPVNPLVHEEDARLSMWRVIKALRGRDHVVVLLVVLSMQHLLMGVMGLMFVVLAVDELGMGASGAGALNVAFGVGALASGLAATLLAGRGRLAPMVAASLAAMAVATMVLGLVVNVPVALVALAVAGCGRSLLDVTARMLLQRSVPPHYLSSTFAIIEVITSVGLAIGTLYSKMVVSTIGAPAGLVIFGAFLVLTLMATTTKMWQADRSADVPIVAVALLHTMPAFAPLHPMALEAVARSSVERVFEPGAVLMQQGDQGDCYHAIAGGSAEVSVDGRHVRSVGRGDGVGEVALLCDGRRTATVTAIDRTQTLEIHRDLFLLAVTGNEASMRAVRRKVDRLDL